MNLRALALALALSCGFTAAAATKKTHPAAHKVKSRKAPKTNNKASHYKAPKAPKAPKTKALKIKKFKHHNA